MADKKFKLDLDFILRNPKGEVVRNPIVGAARNQDGSIAMEDCHFGELIASILTGGLKTKDEFKIMKYRKWASRLGTHKVLEVEKSDLDEVKKTCIESEQISDLTKGELIFAYNKAVDGEKVDEDD